MKHPVIYVSTDIETDGPLPGVNSMLSIGSVAYDGSGKEIDSFSANLETLPGAVVDLKTSALWDANPKAWAACRQDPGDPKSVIEEYVDWIDALPGQPVFVGFPAAFDFMFVYHYLIRFAGRSPFSFSALDIKTLAMAAIGCGFREATKRHMPKAWFGPTKHSHIAVEDAREQGYLFWSIMKELSYDTRGFDETREASKIP
jgi:DNA polymerase III alpha subunit (gram-positive type)